MFSFADADNPYQKRCKDYRSGVILDPRAAHYAPEKMACLSVERVPRTPQQPFWRSQKVSALVPIITSQRRYRTRVGRAVGTMGRLIVDDSRKSIGLGDRGTGCSALALLVPDLRFVLRLTRFTCEGYNGLPDVSFGT